MKRRVEGKNPRDVRSRRRGRTRSAQARRRGLPGQYRSRLPPKIREDAETRERLLDGAQRLFADRGFKDVTVREICREARANVAAVNYHFGDKLGLYRAVLQSAIDRMQETTEEARRAGHGQPAEEQLRRFIGIFIRRLLADRRGTVHRLVTREMMDPTPALDAVADEGVRPRMEYLAGVIADIIGCEPTDARVLRSVASVSTQPAAYLSNPIAERLAAGMGPAANDVDAIAKHIADFSLAGIRAVGQSGRH